MSFELPELDRKATQAKVEEHLERYRLFKYLTFEEREASTVASYEVSEGGRANSISDQTATIAIHNADEQERRKHFCERTERALMFQKYLQQQWPFHCPQQFQNLLEFILQGHLKHLEHPGYKIQTKHQDFILLLKNQKLLM